MDDGSEFVNHKLTVCLAEFGIVHQTTCVYTPQQNGLMECKHRHLLTYARALHFHATLPIVLWGDWFLTAAYLINRTPLINLQRQESI